MRKKKNNNNDVWPSNLTKQYRTGTGRDQGYHLFFGNFQQPWTLFPPPLPLLDEFRQAGVPFVPAKTGMTQLRCFAGEATCANEEQN